MTKILFIFIFFLTDHQMGLIMYSTSNLLNNILLNPSVNKSYRNISSQIKNVQKMEYQ